MQQAAGASATSLALASGLSAGVWTSTAESSVAATAADPLVVGFIGCGGMGNNHLRSLARRQDVKLAWLCEVDEQRLAASLKAVENAGKPAPQGTKDLRQVLADKQVQAVWIATPDHWHAPAAILAADAGKHVYVEKPCSHNLREGRLMIEAARRNKVVMQVGTQSRSTAHITKATRLLSEGAIGKVLVAKAWNSQRRGTIGKQQPSAPPAHLDYDLWLGPAPAIPYQKNFLHGIWRWWYAFGAGDIGNDGVHDIDIARWGLGVTTHPSRIAALGGKYFFDDDQQWPDTQTVAFEYAPDEKFAQPRQLIFEQRIWSPYVQEGFENGNAWYGTEGMLILGKSGGYKLYGPRNKLIDSFEGGSPDLDAHHTNFIECVRSGARPTADIEINHLSTALCHLANIATRTGRVIHFDPKTERVVGDEQADKLVRREYRSNHWAVPKCWDA
ncbi:MAG TPA: Gfo/Idh/MocA family oxidoreductase [Pirellulaceae bacterium]|nr:Gfo/Idh/MocA family oxidoreductase [Pirellulaceae bacterium]